MGATVHRQGQGERHALGASQVVVKAGGAETGGTLFVGETTIEPGFPGPPLHVHDRLHDLFYVLEGTLTMQLDDATHELGPGSFACVPPGIAHTFSNPTDAPVRFLNFNTPSGWENYMRDLGVAGASGPLTRERMGEIASHYDFRAVAP